MTLTKSIFFSTLMFCSIIYADSVPQWTIIPSESNISFTATQNNAPVTGSFKTFTGTISGDPNSLNGTIDLVVNVESVTLNYAELATILVTPEWFNAKAFPKAEFKASKFNKIDDKNYEAIGELTIKNKSVPTTIKFTAAEPAKDHIVVQGQTTLKRSAFEVGTGEWSSTDVIKDDVTINFKIGVERKK